MALQRFNIGTNEDGTPRWHYVSDGHVVLTGPQSAGEVTVEDGTTYDVTPEVIEVASQEHAEQVAAQIEAPAESESE